MTDGPHSIHNLQLLIDRLAKGDDQACAELINHSARRLETLTSRMFRDYRRLGRWEETEDICQNAAIRLWKALKAAPPTTPAEFHRLAALQIRRELIDLVRRHFGPEGIGTNHASNMDHDGSSTATPSPLHVAQSTNDPSKLSTWADFHEQVAALPDDERAAFDLIWYQGLEQSEAAKILGISERTLKRRWLAARLSLGRALDGSTPFQD